MMNLNILKDKRLILWGAGNTALFLIHKYHLKVEYFVSNDKKQQETYIGNIPIKSPDYLFNDSCEKYIVIATIEKHRNDIKRQLEEAGYCEEKDFVEFPVIFPEEITNVRQISYLVNHRCNSRCKMCNIWKNNRGGELSPLELKKLLSNSYFQLTESFLLAGGEPSLSDLPQYAEAISEALPNLKYFSINVNGLLPERTYDMVKVIRDELQKKQINFFVGVSLDGIGRIHDNIRGIDGAFEKAFSLLTRLKEDGVDVQVSATVMKDNVWEMDEYLSFLRERDIEAMFKLVRKSVTLNGGESNGEDDYTEDEIYQLRLFFNKVYRLSQEGYTPGFMTYYQMINEYLENGIRYAKCSFAEGTGVHIKENGDVYICANSRKSISISERNLINLKELNFDDYQFTSHALCPDCISDCMSMDSKALEEFRKRESFFWKFYSIDYFYSHKEVLLNELPKGINENVILITGWYGTETTGDKAILGELVHRYQSKYPDARVCVTSIYPFITKRTARELNIDIEVIPLFSWECLKLAAAAQIVCMGGGPLMDMELLAVPLWLFTIAKANNKYTEICSCGMGPFINDKKVEAVKKIIELADTASFRDVASVKWAKELTGRDDITIDCDPAKKYLIRNYGGKKRNTVNGVIACFLRNPTDEYRGDLTVEEFIDYKEKFNKALAVNLKKLASERGKIIKFYSMHNFCVGGDDRDFAYHFARKYFEPGTYWVDNGLSSVDHIVEAMQEAELCICMRFHSVLFADTLEVNYLGIDYTQGGKIYNFLNDNEELGRLITMKNVLLSDRALLDAVEMNE